MAAGKSETGAAPGWAPPHPMLEAIARWIAPNSPPPDGWPWILLRTWQGQKEHNLTLLAAGLAFYAFLTFIPLLTAFVLSYGLIAEPAAVVDHIEELAGVMPSTAAEIVGAQLQSLTQESEPRTGIGLIVTLGIAVFVASKGARAVMKALNIVNGVGESRSFIARIWLAILLTFAALLVLLLAIMAITVLNFLGDLLPKLGGMSQLLIQIASFALAPLLVAIVLGLIYRYGPNRADARSQWITPGALLATLGWLAATIASSIYVSYFSDLNITYGSLGAVIVFLTWLFSSAYIVLLGAELNRVLEADPIAPEAAPEPVADTSPSITNVVTRLGFFSILSSILDRGDRPSA